MAKGIVSQREDLNRRFKNKVRRDREVDRKLKLKPSERAEFMNEKKYELDISAKGNKQVTDYRRKQDRLNQSPYAGYDTIVQAFRKNRKRK